jgi:hypothetical protein
MVRTRNLNTNGCCSFHGVMRWEGRCGGVGYNNFDIRAKERNPRKTPETEIGQQIITNAHCTKYDICDEPETVYVIGCVHKWLTKHADMLRSYSPDNTTKQN